MTRSAVAPGVLTSMLSTPPRPVGTCSTSGGTGTDAVNPANAARKVGTSASASIWPERKIVSNCCCCSLLMDGFLSSAPGADLPAATSVSVGGEEPAYPSEYPGCWPQWWLMLP